MGLRRALLQVPVPRSSGGMLAFGGALLQVPVPSSSGGMLAIGGFASFAPTYRDPLEPLVAKLPVLTLQPWESALAPVHSANTRIPSIR